jgi:hypothetical protein
MGRFVAEDVERSCVGRKVLRFERRGADPSRGLDERELAM